MADIKVDYVAAQLRAKRWKQADLVRETGLDKNTISDFMTGKRKPSLDTLSKIEDALDLIRGTLAGLGEDSRAGTGPASPRARLIEEELQAVRRAGLSAYGDDELLDEMRERLRRLRRELDDSKSGQQTFWDEIELGQPVGGADGAPSADVAPSGREEWAVERQTALNYLQQVSTATAKSDQLAKQLLRAEHSNQDPAVVLVVDQYAWRTHTDLYQQLDARGSTIDETLVSLTGLFDQVTAERNAAAHATGGRRKPIPTVQDEAAREDKGCAALTAAAGRIGVPGFHPHEFRHTAASLAIASGADVKVVQRMLGHKSATMTLDLYGHLFPDRLDVVADALERSREDALKAGVPKSFPLPAEAGVATPV